MHNTRSFEPSATSRLAAYVGFVATLAFAILTALVVAHRTAAIDRSLILSLRADATPLLTTILLAVTFTSGRLAVPALIIFALALYKRSGGRAALYYIAACITAQILDALLKFGVHRPRPHGISPKLTDAGGLSYPSADAMLAAVIFGLGAVMLGWTVRSSTIRVTLLAASGAFVIVAAVARVYLGAHWPTDVVGGVLAGLACAAFYVSALRPSPRAPEALETEATAQS